MILFNGQKIEFGQFPNGEINIDKPFFAKNWSSDLNVVTLKYEGDQDLFRLFLVRKAIWFPCDLEIYYFPYSRMDRSSKEYIFTLKSVAKFINLMEWAHVIVYEPHSDVTPALLNHVRVVDVTVKLVRNLAMPGDFQVFYPDAGAQKRYSEKLGISDELIGFKKRDFKTGRILDLQIVGERTKDTVVIVDDLCSKGGTFVLAAEKLKAIGFDKIRLVVAHCEKTIFDGKVFTSGLIEKVITTDSILDVDDANEYLRIIPINRF